MHSARRIFRGALICISLAVFAQAAEYRFDDEEPEVTDRVARFSYVYGDVQIRRAETDQSEKVVLNLPVVEGDEITAGVGARFEIQFNTASHIRVSENSYLKVESLKDGAVALSLAEGTASMTISKFDPANESYEIDAPRTTVAIQRTGRYRVDAGKNGDQEVRISVSEKGEARIYSNNSGFTLRDGRSARVFIEGNLAGEWESGETSRFADDFDTWVAERDSHLAKRLADAHYGQYYDNDIYGADELNGYGDWVHTRDYGYIWRPYRSSVVSYSDWSPYRYGHWRWLPAYGWTWVNDEPWGWATYHHGRWIWYNGGWYWTPYGYYRHRRSWWYPALVVLRVINRSVCWYPLPYHYGYYNYNRHYYSRHPRRRHQPGNRVSEPIKTEDPDRGKRIAGSPPDTGVISVPVDDFGKGTRVNTKVPRDIARGIVAREPSPNDDLPRLPVMRDIQAKIGNDIRPVKPRELPGGVSAKIGAARRDQGEPLDKSLRDKIVYGNRRAVQPRIGTDVIKPASDGKPLPRTGAVQRPVTPPSDRVVKEPLRDDTVRQEPPRTVKEPQRTITPTPRSEPQEKEQPRQAVPRSEPPKRSEPPAPKEPSRSEPSKKEQPRSDPPRKSEPSREKSESRKPSSKAETRQ